MQGIEPGHIDVADMNLRAGLGKSLRDGFPDPGRGGRAGSTLGSRDRHVAQFAAGGAECDEADPLMEVIYLLIPISLIFLGGILWLLFWAVRSGQFDDMEGPAHRILMDEDKVVDEQKNSRRGGTG